MKRMKKFLLLFIAFFYTLVSCDSLGTAFELKQYGSDNKEVENIDDNPSEKEEETNIHVAKKYYMIRWLNYDESEIYSEKIEEGFIPFYNTNKYGIPGRAMEGKHTFVFKGWTPEIIPVYKNTQYTAMFDDIFDGCIATFVDYTGEKILFEKNFVENQIPEYGGPVPTKPDTEDYEYTFAGWDPDPRDGIVKNTTYKPIFTARKKYFTITWKDEDGTILLEENYSYGDTPSFPGGSPDKSNDPVYHYTFTGWDPEITGVNKDRVYVATYIKEIRKYTVDFKLDGEETAFFSKQYYYGYYPQYPEVNTTSDDKYIYQLGGWDKPIEEVRGDQTYTFFYTNYPKRGFFVQTNANNRIISWSDLVSKRYMVLNNGNTKLQFFSTSSLDGSFSNPGPYGKLEGYLFIDPKITLISNETSQVFVGCTGLKSISYPPNLEVMSPLCANTLDALDAVYIPKEMKFYPTYLNENTKNVFYTGTEKEFAEVENNIMTSESAKECFKRAKIKTGYKYKLPHYDY